MKKKVLIIEDADVLRLSLQSRLEACGFDVYGAGDVGSARQLAEQHWADLDVAILDMQLSDPAEPTTTGADIAIEFRQRKSSFPPESLIYSARSEINYYRLALTLGSAAYLSKNEDTVDDVIQHVRALMLRRALSAENPEVAAKVARIVEQSRSQAEAVKSFCRVVLQPEFEACLDAPFVILVTEGEVTKNCTDNVGLPTGNNAFYTKLNALVHGKGGQNDPFVLDTHALSKPTDSATALLYDKLNGAAFLPLSLSSDMRLSIGILCPTAQTQPAGSNERKASYQTLARYIRPTVLEVLFDLWTRWNESKAMAIRVNTAKLCLSVGQEIRDSIKPVEMERLELLANDLSDTGELLVQLADQHRQEPFELYSIRDVITSVWDALRSLLPQPVPQLDLRGDCAVDAERRDLEVIVSRLLQWFVHRRTTTPLDVAPVITVKCETTGNDVSIVFEDTSLRLHPMLRADLFAPFTQAISIPFDSINEDDEVVDGTYGATPRKTYLNRGRYLPLYLAKMLVEGRYQGQIKDCSDEIEEHNYGHRIVVHFPMRRQLGKPT